MCRECEVVIESMKRQGESSAESAPDLRSILEKADDIVNTNRQGEYGDPVENWVRTALVATITQGKAMTPIDLIQAMHAVKMVRAGKGKRHEDSNIDQAGYAEIRDRVQLAWESGEIQKIVEKILSSWVKFPAPCLHGAPNLTIDVPRNSTISVFGYSFGSGRYEIRRVGEYDGPSYVVQTFDKKK